MSGVNVAGLKSLEEFVSWSGVDVTVLYKDVSADSVTQSYWINIPRWVFRLKIDEVEIWIMKSTPVMSWLNAPICVDVSVVCPAAAASPITYDSMIQNARH